MNEYETFHDRYSDDVIMTTYTHIHTQDEEDDNGHEMVTKETAIEEMKRMEKPKKVRLVDSWICHGINKH